MYVPFHMDFTEQWQIGDQSTYFQATATCPAGTTFDVPRTALENRFLLATMRKAEMKNIWVNLNSLKAPNCWTVGNTNCPYGDSVRILNIFFLLAS